MTRDKYIAQYFTVPDWRKPRDPEAEAEFIRTKERAPKKSHKPKAWAYPAPADIREESGL